MKANKIQKIGNNVGGWGLFLFVIGALFEIKPLMYGSFILFLIGLVIWLIFSNGGQYNNRGNG